ncbi:MAG: threonine-phosphate decarboxylase [Desulfuromonadales bacterium GWD2_61_12]|nr:MAG: threonine-phosphate decarboxylase [Desulfuromonadales bacterium GWD2_61_12]HAD03990.1 threonine-phosphate decarboxylase [Desulfuromonas sp.]HBT83482.1 threonine-phosphate decarboxylase [Desulfuromonas sp.]
MSGHGGDVAAAARELGLPASEVLDFSASINPLGIPAGVLAAAQRGVAESVHYPEIAGDALAAALAAHHGLSAEHFLPGAGSTPLFYLLARVLRPRRVLLVEPAFSEYRRSLTLSGAVIDPFLLDPANDFALDSRQLLARLTPETDLVLLANPGNPSGAALPPALLRRLAAALRGRALLVVDEAFVDFAPDLSLMPGLSAGDNLLIFRSLTKFYAIPGLRVGYLAAQPELVARLAAAAEPWALSTPALNAGQACLAEADYRRRSLALIPAWRDELAAGLRRLGWQVHPSVANYLLARLPDGAQSSRELATRLRRQGILLRSCRDFVGLNESYLRLAVRTAAENQRLLAALAAAVTATEKEAPC